MSRKNFMRSKISTASALAFALGVGAGLISPTNGQSVSDCTVQVSASVQADPPQITLLWPALDSAISYSVSRKSRDETNWGSAVGLPPSAASYVDTNVVIGNTYEYHVFRTATNCIGHSYIYTGIQAPLIDSRGKVILVVDRTFASSLAAELAVLQQDLVGDGWTVLRHDVPRMVVDPADLASSAWTTRSNELAAVKSLIRADYLADRANVKAVFLIGHVPVPYSGALAPDGHPDHLGAWPADVYYGDMDGNWTDSSVNITTANDPRNRNVPGDGKFDQSNTSVPLALQVGRVDMANLPAFPDSELELLRRYLGKDHQFRQTYITAHPRGLIDDNFGALNAEVPAANGWANFAPLLGATNVTSGRWLTDLSRSDYLWAYGCGPGTYTGATGVAETLHFLVYDMRVVFTMLFGSYFGDWDSQNNFLRAPLAAAAYTLTAAWTGRPNWYFHHMALGETIGFSTRLSQNNNGLYQDSSRMNGLFFGGVNPTENLNGVHIALMGDPTLRLQPLAPPVSLVALTNGTGGVDLSWGSSWDDVVGYHVYRAPAPGGPYSRLSSSFISGNAYSDLATSSERYYMVRAVKLETSGSGSYYNPSQGAFAELSLAANNTETNTWAGQGVGVWKINDATGTAGSDPGWDRLMLDDTLNVSATSANQFTVRIVSATSANTPGTPAHFNNGQTYTWPILTAALGVTGFDPAKINLLTTDFQGDLGGGVFNLALSADTNSVNLVFTPNRPPMAQPALYNREWDKPLLIPIADFLARFTSDADGDDRALTQVGSSTNGTSISSDGTTLVFTSTNNVAETVTYWVQDVRAYRPGDTVRTASSSLTIQPLPKAIPFTAYHAIEVEWQGDPGKRYQVQSRLETDSAWTNLGDSFIASGEKTSLFERTSAVTKFYRIVLLE
jgi:hypothetical protein